MIDKMTADVRQAHIQANPGQSTAGVIIKGATTGGHEATPVTLLQFGSNIRATIMYQIN